LVLKNSESELFPNCFRIVFRVLSELFQELFLAQFPYCFSVLPAVEHPESVVLSLFPDDSYLRVTEVVLEYVQLE
jgi:hypothetical protein